VYSSTYVKHRLVGTALQRPLQQVRWFANYFERRKHPELFNMHYEDAYLREAVTRLLEPSMNCIDGGSHIGTMLASFVKAAPLGSHIAFEPVQEKADWLKKRWPQAEIHQAAISDQEGTATFFEDRSSSAMSSLKNTDANGTNMNSYSVRVVRIDDVVGNRDIGFVKLDVEGNELFAMKGARATFDRCKPALVFECGPGSVVEAFGYSRGDLWDYLQHELKYSVWFTSDYLFSRDPMGRHEFERAGTYPFVGFNYVALPVGTVLPPRT
jgi:FkbM family methyltransferase